MQHIRSLLLAVTAVFCIKAAVQIQFIPHRRCHLNIEEWMRCVAQYAWQLTVLYAVPLGTGGGLIPARVASQLWSIICYPLCLLLV